MNIKEYVDKMTSDKEDRLLFNELSESDVELFKTNFLSVSETLQIEYLLKILDETNENELSSGNFYEFFNTSTIKHLLLKCI